MLDTLDFCRSKTGRRELGRSEEASVVNVMLDDLLVQTSLQEVYDYESDLSEIRKRSVE